MNRNTLRRAAGAAAVVFWAAATALAAGALAVQFRIRIANEWQQNALVAAATAPSAHDRIVVFAPHSDDETLGCGGMLALASMNQARVRVVLVTNGDGFRIAVGRAYKTIRVTPQQCIEFAYKRQRETLNALATLGVSEDRIIFLGYPDRGIARLWERHWESDNLYVSHATGLDRSPYTNSYTRNAPHCGESLLSDIVSILREEKPTDIYIPHPSDNHADHYATYCFVMAAVEQLRAENAAFASGLRAHTYLVHRGDWPCPRGDYLEKPLSAPYSLSRADTRWRSLQLPGDVAQAKRRAIKCYKTQTAIERTFLISFARENELFGSIPTHSVELVDDKTIAIDGETDDWAGIAPAAVHPVGDYVVADISKGGDVRAIYLCRDSRRLFIRIDFAGKVSKRIAYLVNLRRLAADGSDIYAVRLKPGTAPSPDEVTAASKGTVIEMAAPLSAIGPGDDLFVQVKTRLGRLTVDDTGWRGVGFSQR